MADTSIGRLQGADSTGAYVPVDAVFSTTAPASADALSLGEKLQRARADAGFTLDSASARTRIKRDYLEALEMMDPRGLPSRAYAVGYLRTYAAFLGLDVAGCLEQFKQEVECEAGRSEPTAPQERREIKLPRGMVGAVLILVGVVGAAGWYGNYITRSEAMAGVGAPLDALMAAEEPLVTLSERAAPAPAAIWSNLPEAAGAGALVFEAGAAVMLEVRDASGRILVSRRMDPGEVYRAPEEPGLTISTDDAGSILVRAGGRVVGPLGAGGEAVSDVSASELVLTAMSEREDG